MLTHRSTPDMTPLELIARIESGVPIRVLDIRAPEALASGRIDILSADRFVNVRGSEVMVMGQEFRKLVPMDGPLAVVCGRGNASKPVAQHLVGLGYAAHSLRGGMLAWADALVERKLRAPTGFDHLIQFDRVAKGSLAYLLVSGGDAVIVDPPRRVQPILDRARSLGSRIVAVADTHAHADYLSGGPALARALGIPYYLHPLDGISPYDGRPGTVAFTPAEEGAEIPVGSGTIRVEHNPGHTEGSVTYRAGDASLTGDFIFVRSVGRPDLGGKAEEWTIRLWRSLERARRDWPEESRVHPGHYASDEEREPDRSVGRTLRSLLPDNEPLKLREERAFFDWVLARVGPSPEAYRKIKIVNIGLLEVWDAEAQELDCGRNECALGG